MRKALPGVGIERKTLLSGGKSRVLLSPILYLLLLSLSFFLCFISFLPLTATQQGAISHSAQRGLEELKATEQKKRIEKLKRGKETGELEDWRRG